MLYISIYIYVDVQTLPGILLGLGLIEDRLGRFEEVDLHSYMVWIH